MWDVEMLLIVRHMINDVDSTNYTYTDQRLREAILVSAQLVLSQIDFAQSYTIDVDAYTISPDPTSDTKDNAFINLVAMKCACMILTGEAKTAAGQALDIRDGSSFVGLKGIAKSKLDIAKYFCESFEKSKVEYIAGSRCPGEAIVSPFRIMNTNQYYRHY